MKLVIPPLKNRKQDKLSRLYVSPKLRMELRIYAESKGVTLQSLVERFLTEGLERAVSQDEKKGV